MRGSNGNATGRRSVGGFTLLEVMVATAVTLLMMLALVQIFAIIGDSMKQGRAALELNNRLRSITFRLRHDLNNLTIRVEPPADLSSGAGYVEYTDGSMTDATCLMFDPLNGADSTIPTDKVRSSRVGDLDDILMYTARAGDSWFTGKVPRFVLEPGLLSSLSDGNGNGVIDAIETVVISSQHAEIAVFARPVNTDTTDDDPSVAPYHPFDDVDGNNLPDAYQLYYRTLLVRPDLNTVSGHLPNALPTSSIGRWLCVGTAGGDGLPTDMATAHQQCDLSIRRVYDGAPGIDFVAANSLEDLMNPANRFAHFEYRLLRGGLSTTMPLLVLDPIPPASLSVFADDSNAATISPLYSDPSTLGGTTFRARGNFLNPSFVLGASVFSDDLPDSIKLALSGRLGEDILASDVLAFDVKGFDSTAPILAMYGPDGVAGSSGATGLGADGSDDLVVTPSDPGFAPAVVALGSGAAAEVGRGAYVDLLWGRKSLSTLPYFGMSLSNIGSAYSGNFVSELSGLQVVGGSFAFAEGLTKSGKIIVNPSSPEPPVIMQATFDTWTNRYEGDGMLQSEFFDGSNVLTGVVQIDRYKQQYNSTSGASDLSRARPLYRQSAIDAGTDGLDNDALSGTVRNGADDLGERETLPPFPIALRGLKASIRIEDKATRQVKQMSVANEFVTQ